MFKVISGAQTGADIAGLWAAKLFGIPTGGWAPKNFLTLIGDHPEMAKTFGIKEHARSYAGRTVENLKMSDFTIVCASVMSAGSKLTIKECCKQGIAHQVIMFDQSDLSGGLRDTNIDGLVNRIDMNNKLGLDFVLNVAGNSTNNSSRAFEFTFKLCYELFTRLGYKTDALPKDYRKYQDIYDEVNIRS